jgi:hypothetical protein
VCRSGKEIRPGFWRNPIGVTMTAFVLLPMLSLFVWSNVLEIRAGRKRVPRPPVRLKHRRRR